MIMALRSLAYRLVSAIRRDRWEYVSLHRVNGKKEVDETTGQEQFISDCWIRYCVHGGEDIIRVLSKSGEVKQVDLYRMAYLALWDVGWEGWLVEYRSNQMEDLSLFDTGDEVSWFRRRAINGRAVDEPLLVLE